MKTYNPGLKSTVLSPNLMTNQYGSLLSDDELTDEQKRRRKNLMFPLSVFPEPLKPLIADLLGPLQGERSFIGLTMLQTASIAIGSALRARTPSGWNVNLSIWGASVGISSSGKSMMQSLLLRPLFDIQERLNDEFFDQEVAEGQDKRPRQAILVQDITFEALIKRVFGHNFKGIARYEDELVKVFDDMERYKSGASEVSFWTGSWSPTSDFTQERVGGGLIRVKQIHRVSSIIGSTQPNVLWRFYDKGRLDTGYVFRYLFAFPDEDKAISPNLEYRIPNEYLAKWNQVVNRLYTELPMQSVTDQPRTLIINKDATKLFQEWQDKQTKAVNQEDNLIEKNVKAGLLGKIKEYALRLAVILRAVDATFYESDLKAMSTSVSDLYMDRALRCCDYFMKSGWEAYLAAQQRLITPPVVLEFANSYRAHGCSGIRLADFLGISPQAVSKRLKKYMQQYPTAFGAKN